MHKLSTIALLASCLAFVAAKPMPSQAKVHERADSTSSSSEPTYTAVKRRRTHNCNQDDRLKKIEAQAWADAGAMADVADEYDNGNEWQPAMNYWMGYDSKKSENFWKIQNVLSNEKKIHNPNWIFPEAVVDIYCGDTYPKRVSCPKVKDPRNPTGPRITPFARSWISRGWFYNTYNTVLCPRFFEEKYSVEYLLHDMKNGKRHAWNASEYKLAWGHTIYHELVHQNPIIAANEVEDIAYYACPAAKLANQNGCSGKYLWDPPGWDKSKGDPHTLINADSWAFFASGSYFQKAMKLSEPGRAINDCGIYSAATEYNVSSATLANSPAYAPEGILGPTVNRTDGTFHLKVPPNPAPENTPPDDPPTPALPYNGSSLTPGLAMPFNAIQYFATYTPAANSSNTS